MNEIVTDINYLTSSQELVKTSTSLNDQVTLLEQFINFSNSKYISASIYDRNGTLVADTSSFSTNKNITNKEFFKQALDGKPYFDKIPTLFAPNQSGLYYSAPIYDANNETNRVIVIQVPLDFIDRIINTSVFYETTGDDLFKFNTEIYLDNGSLVYSNKPHNLSSSSSSSPSSSLAEDSIMNLLPEQSLLGQDRNTNSFNSILISVAENSDIKRFEDNVNWTLVLEGDLSALVSDYNRTINEFLLLSSITLAITIGVTFLLIRKIVLPLTHLKDAALEISKGNFSKPISIEGVSEVRDLSVSFETMRRNIENFNKNLVKRVEERTRELRTVIEELRKKESEVKTINAELIKANIAKEEFLSMVSHELKSPITPMKLYVEMLLKTDKLDNLNEFQKKALNMILRNILKLETIINDIFAVYKLDLGNFTLNKKVTKVRELVESNVSGLAPMMKEKNIIFRSIINTDGKVLCDPIRIGQVLTNLVNNAVDHVHDVGGIITIRIDETEDSKSISSKDIDNNQLIRKKIIFTVEDNGIGIPPDKIENLFKKFYQIDTGLRRKYGGTGLGLTICKGIIESHGGKIWIDPSYRNGASFKFSLDAC